LHSIFGASKTAGDVMAQEYGKYYGLKVGVFRGGCLTGRAHCGVELHGFLSYLVHVAIHRKPYTIYGYKGKQVRDQIDSTDVIRALEAFACKPRAGEVYNLGGGRSNSASVIECIDLIEKLSGYRIEYRLSDQNRLGDHMCYISDCRKFQRDYPQWRVGITLEDMVEAMIQSAQPSI
jgi:CDP-paratose 2-epimerase